MIRARTLIYKARGLAAEEIARSVMVITSGAEGKPGDRNHMKKSKHYPANNIEGKSNADDYRFMDFAWLWGKKAKELLGKAYDVVVEKDHIHVEYDPK